MPVYDAVYYREQRCYTTIDATDLESAKMAAQLWCQTLRLDSEDDESDDPGELDVEEQHAAEKLSR